MDRQIAEAVANAGGSTLSELGLRFDRVALRVLGRLRTSAEISVPDGLMVVLALSAPIRAPGKIVDALEREVAALLNDGVGSERSAVIQGNQAELRMVEQPFRRGHKLLGFVHNPDVPAGRVLDLAKNWLRSNT